MATRRNILTMGLAALGALLLGKPPRAYALELQTVDVCCEWPMPSGVTMSLLLDGTTDRVKLDGYGITRGVPKAFWDEWSAQNSPLIRERLIYAVEDLA